MKPEFMINNSMLGLENYLMRAILKSLIDLGGIADRKEIKRDINDNSDIIPKDFIDYSPTSERTSKKYNPFTIRFGFAVKHLNYADLVMFPKRGLVELTEKGRKIDLEQFKPEIDVRILSQPIFDRTSKKKTHKS